MKSVGFLTLVLVASGFAQDVNPVATAARKQIMERAHNLVAAAKLMPAEKYDYKASAAQMTFGHMVHHTMRANNGMCALVAGEKHAQPEIKDSDPKDKLVAALEESVAYCDGVLAKVSDKTLAEKMKTPWGAEMTRAEMLLEINADQADHYSLAATYLRLNGLLPPTAKK